MECATEIFELHDVSKILELQGFSVSSGKPVYAHIHIHVLLPSLLPVAYNNLLLYPSPSVHCFLLIQELYSAASGPTLNKRGLLIA